MAICQSCTYENPDSARFCGRCGSMLEQLVSDDPLVGRLVAGRYHVVRLIAEGGMGRVYLADQRMGTAMRSVALKVIASTAPEPDDVARFFRECETVVKLQHTNTIRFYDFGQEILEIGGRETTCFFIVMEYVDGPSLRELIDRGPLPIHTVERLIRQIGGALGEAHGHGIIHRDLKPENVLIVHDPVDGETAKVLDFGLARPVPTASLPGVTTPGTILGTPAYMSPEQFSGASIDARSDVYALALLAYEMLTGEPPFRASTAIEWATAHMLEEPRSFDEFPATQSLGFERRAAILHGLVKDPEKRTPSVIALVDELCGRTGRTGPPPARDTPSAAPPSEVEVASTVIARPRRRRSPVLVVVGLLAGALVAAAVVIGIVAMSTGDGDDEASDAGASRDAGQPAPDDAGPPPVPDGPREEWMTLVHYERRVGSSDFALGAPDGRCATVRAGGMITFVLAPGQTKHTDGTDAAELRVVVDDTTSGPYRLQVGMHHDVYATVAHAMTGSALVDVDPADVHEFRTVRIQNRAGRGTVCVDAVAVRGPG